MKRGRPNSAAKRRHRSVRFSSDELAAIRAKAGSVGLSFNAYVRAAALDQRIIAPVPEVNREAWSELSRLAANVNQITKSANGGNLSATRLLPSILSQLSERVRLLRLTLIGGSAEP